MNKAEELKKIIEKSNNICVFSGAGISCPSGIPDFRSADGLYNNDSGFGFSPEEIISHTFFKEHTDLFYQFYKSKMVYPGARPNEAHRYFAGLEKQGKRVSVVTQNIDGLHNAAGSSEVYELHGSIFRNHCTKCGKFYPLEKIISSAEIPLCDDDNAVIKPDVVLYEEPLDDNVVNGAISAIASAKTVIVIGTSLAVYPAASFLKFFRGDNLVLINKSSTPYDSNADLVINDDIINVIKKL